MSSRLSKKYREQAEVAFFGPLIRRVLKALDNAEARERDLKARLKSIRSAMGRADFPDHGVGYCQQPDCALCREYKTTDLRVKNWRKP